jgi:DNA-binding transcriptional regulator YhcF (GntR family)
VDIVLNRRGGVPVKDQLATQLQMEILGGALSHGQKLPSVRALARRLKIHHNTVSAAYQDLEQAGHVELRRGAGVFVRRAGPISLPDARGLDEMIRVALQAAYAKGFSGQDVRVAVERWLRAAPPDRVIVVDPGREMAELMRHEIGEVGAQVEVATPEDIARDPGLLTGALAVCLPYHARAVQRFAPGAGFEELTLEAGVEERRAVASLPAGSIVLVVSHAPTVLPFASVFLRTLRGDELVVETYAASDTEGWRRVVRAADLVFADTLCAPMVRKSRPRRLQEFRLLTAASLDRLREGMKTVAPALSARARR